MVYFPALVPHNRAKGPKAQYGILSPLAFALAFIASNLLVLPGRIHPAQVEPRCPAWLFELSKRSLPELPPETEAVYLLREQTLAYSSKG